MKKTIKVIKNDYLVKSKNQTNLYQPCGYCLMITYTFTDFDEYDKYTTEHRSGQNPWDCLGKRESDEIVKQSIAEKGFYKIDDVNDLSTIIYYLEYNIHTYNHKLYCGGHKYITSCYHLDEHLFWVIYNNLYNFYKLDYITASNTEKSR